MNSFIKITLELESGKTFDTINELETRLDGIINKAAGPVNINIVPPSLDEIKNLGNISLLLNELNAPRAGINSSGKSSINNTVVSGSRENELKKEENEFLNHQIKLAGIEKKYSLQRRETASDESRSKLKSAELMLLSAGGLFGSQAALYKTISIAEATMSAYNAANAALLPPPIGAGPILGEIQAGIVLMNSLKRVERIAAAQIPGYAKGGIVVGEKGPEVIENMQDYASGRAELIQKTVIALQNGLNGTTGLSSQLFNEIKSLRSDLNKILERPALAFLDDREAKKVYYRGGYFARKTR